MRILFVIDTYDTQNNGTSISAQRFAAELRRRGHEVKILTSGEPGEDRFALPTFHMPVFQPLMDKHDFNFAYSDKDTVHKACDWADVVHIYVPFAISVDAITYCHKTNKPVTAAFHIQPENMTSSVNMGNVEWFNEMFYRNFRRFIYDRVRHVHCVSEFMARMIRERGYKAKLHVISNGIQDEFLDAGQQFADHGRPQKTPDLQGKILITMVGRLSGEKRQDVLINAVPYSKYADKIQLAFAGRGPKYEEYVALGDKLANKPLFLYLSKEELIHHLGMTDLYVHASDMESEAISCIEAFATGLVPVIANSDLSATPQFALDGRSLFKPGHPQDLARAIDYWLDHPNERQYVGELYRQSAKKYSLANSVSQFEQMLQEEIDEHKA